MRNNSEDVAEVERRCLLIVSAAEKQARAAQQALVQENERLRNALVEREETFATQFEQAEATIKLQIHRLQEVSNQFILAHRETTALIQQCAQRREEMETRTVAAVNSAMLRWLQLHAIERRRGNQFVLSRVAQHLTTPGRQVLQGLSQGTFEYISQNARGAIEALVSNGSDASNNKADSLAALTNLLERPMGRAHAILVEPWLRNPPDQASGDPLLGFSDPVMCAMTLYLITSVDILDRFGDKLLEYTVQFMDAMEAKRENHLAERENALLIPHAAAVMQSSVPSLALESTVTETMWTAVVEAASTRRVLLIQQLQQLELQGCHHTGAMIQQFMQKVVDVVVNLLSDSLYVPKAMATGQQLQRSSELNRKIRTLCGDSDGEATTTDADSADVMAPPPVMTALFHFANHSSALADRLLIHAVESHQAALRRIQTEMSVNLDTIQRIAQTTRNIVVEQRVTEIRLEDLRIDSQHQQVMRTIYLEREKHIFNKSKAETETLRNEVEHLKSELERLRCELNTVQERAVMAEAEVTLLREIASRRKQSADVMDQVREETKVVHYVVNSNAVAETWQEALLRLRERILTELSTDNARFLAKLRSYLRQKEVNIAALEQLYDARLRSTVRQLEDDHANQKAAMSRRFDATIASTVDSHAREIEAMRSELERERVAMQRHFETAYDDRVSELNHLFELRSRRLRQRENELEDQMAIAMRQMREAIRARENQHQIKLLQQYQEMVRSFDEESVTRRGEWEKRQRELEHAHLQAEAVLESRVTEKIKFFQHQFEQMAQMLQSDVLKFVGEKQSFFDQFRNEELMMLSNFVHQREAVVSSKFSSMMDSVKTSFTTEKDQAVMEGNLALEQLMEAHEKERRQLEAELQQRLTQRETHQEHAFRVAQDLHEKQNHAFWEACHAKLVESEKSLMERRAELEVEHQRRYNSIIDSCQSMLQRDFRAAREAFEAELHQRYAMLHAGCGPLLHIQLLSEHLGWEEDEERAHVLHLEQMKFHSLMIAFTDGRLLLARCEYRAMDASSLGMDREGRMVSVDELHRLRSAFEERILANHSYIRQLSHDTVAAVEVSLEASHQDLQRMWEVQTTQIQEVSRALLSKMELFEEARGVMLGNRLQQFVENVNMHLSPLQVASVHVGTDSTECVARRIAGSVSSTVREWEQSLNNHSNAAHRNHVDTLHRVHDEYVATTTAFMARLETCNAELERSRSALQQQEATVQAQATELKKAINFLRNPTMYHRPGTVWRTSEVRAEVATLVSETLNTREMLFMVEASRQS